MQLPSQPPFALRARVVSPLGDGRSLDLPDGVLSVDPAGVSRIAFVRDGAVLLVEQEGERFGPERELDRFEPAEDVRPRLGADGEGRLAAAWIAGGELRLSLGVPGAFGPPRRIDAGIEPPGARALDLHLTDGGRLALAYIREGDVHLARGEPDGSLAPQRIASSDTESKSPMIRSGTAPISSRASAPPSTPMSTGRSSRR